MKHCVCRSIYINLAALLRDVMGFHEAGLLSGCAWRPAGCGRIVLCCSAGGDGLYVRPPGRRQRVGLSPSSLYPDLDDSGVMQRVVTTGFRMIFPSCRLLARSLPLAAACCVALARGSLSIRPSVHSGSMFLPPLEGARASWSFFISAFDELFRCV